MKEEDLNFHLGHRERLRQKFLDNKLTDYELLELLLSFVIPRKDVRPLARGMLVKFGSIYQILTASIDSLMEYSGIGKNTAIFIKAIHQIMITGYKTCLTSSPIFHNDKILANYCSLLLNGKTIEEFHILYLNSERKSVVLLHNHPTPNTSFSSEDIEITTNIKNMLEPLGIELYDHYVVSGGIIYSARNLFLLK